MKILVTVALLFFWGSRKVDSRAPLFERIDVCRHYLGYAFYGYFPGCYFDHNVLAPTSTLITRYNYHAERHKIVSPDGYILSMHRIVPKTSNSTAVILLHSMLTNSASFLALKRDSLAFMLADCGFDVFLPDLRGTEYSLEHMNLTINNEKFWDFSIDEIAKYDVPTMLEFVERLTGQKQVIVIGHGFGSTPIFMYSSTHPEASKERIKLFIALGPVAEQRNNKFWLWSRFLRPLYRPLYTLLKMTHSSKLLSYYDYQRNAASVLVSLLPYVFIRFLILSFGKDDQIGAESIPFFVNHFWAGGSFKTFVHGTQTAKEFAKFDYGKSQNMKMYGLERPPIYNVSKIVHPVYLVSSDDDFVSDKTDSILLYTALSDQARAYGRFQVVRPNVNQLGLVFGKDAAALIYNNILDLVGSVTDNQAQCHRAIKEREERPAAIEGPKKDEMVSSLIKGAKDMFKRFQTQDKPTKPVEATNKFNFNFLDLMKSKGKVDDKVILSPTGDKKARKVQKEKVERLEKHQDDEDDDDDDDDGDDDDDKDSDKKSGLDGMFNSALSWVKDKMKIGMDMLGMSEDKKEGSNREPILLSGGKVDLDDDIVDTASYNKDTGDIHEKSYKDPDPKNHNKIPDKIAGSDIRPKVIIKPTVEEDEKGDDEGEDDKESKESGESEKMEKAKMAAKEDKMEDAKKKKEEEQKTKKAQKQMKTQEEGQKKRQEMMAKKMKKEKMEQEKEEDVEQKKKEEQRDKIKKLNQKLLMKKEAREEYERKRRRRSPNRGSFR